MGLAIGVAIGMVAGRAMRNLLYGVGAADPMTFAVSAAAFTLVALLASALPAQRAARIDPNKALREE